MIGTIVLWNGSVPSGWQICDGTNGTPNLVGAYARGANSDSDLKDAGGGGSHTHSATTTDARAAHNHGGSAAVSCQSTSSDVEVYGNTGVKVTADHSHSGGSATLVAADGHSHTMSTTGGTTYSPTHIQLIYIIKMS